MSTGVIVMSKVPLPGRTKSRLQEKIGAQAAALFHRACLYDLQVVLRTCGMPARIYIAGGSREDFCSAFPHTLPEEFTCLGKLDWSDFTLYRQHGRDLGERMLCAMQESLTEFQQVILIGSDIPGIDQNLLELAYAELREHNLVLGPARDGGYYLIGLKSAEPFLFGESRGEVDEYWSKPCRLPGYISCGQRYCRSCEILTVGRISKPGQIGPRTVVESRWLGVMPVIY